MIGIDTDILLRLWLYDDPAQNKRIDALPARHGSTPGSLLVVDVVLAEAVWTLRSSRVHRPAVVRQRPVFPGFQEPPEHKSLVGRMIAQSA